MQSLCESEANDIEQVPERAAQDARDQEVQSDETEEQQASQTASYVEGNVENFLLFFFIILTLCYGKLLLQLVLFLIFRLKMVLKSNY